MNAHGHRPAYLDFMDNKRVCRCRHCQQPLRCVNRWLHVVSLIPALLAMLYVIATGLQNWPVLLVAFLVDAALQYLAFRHLKFEIDVVAQRDDSRNSLRR